MVPSGLKSKYNVASIDLEFEAKNRRRRTNLEAEITALTPGQVNAAFRRHVDQKAISVVKGGDFKKAGAYQE